jgi:hypothetical protein
MNANIEILDEIKHQTLMVDFEEARAASRKESLFPIVLSEFHSLMFHYPIVFVKSQETGEFTCSVLLGVSQNANLLDEQSITHDEVIPLNIRRLPLLAIAPPGDAPKQRPLIGINMKSPGVGHGEFFLKQKSVAFESAMVALSQLYEGYAETKRFVKIALELDLITKLKAEIHYKDKPKLTLEGLYGIDANKIAQMKERDTKSKELFLEIASYAYAQNFSLHNMQKLVSISS